MLARDEMQQTGMKSSTYSTSELRRAKRLEIDNVLDGTLNYQQIACIEKHDRPKRIYYFRQQSNRLLPHASKQSDSRARARNVFGSHRIRVSGSEAQLNQ